MTPERQKQLDEHAMMMAQGQIFGTWNIREGDRDLIGSIFLPLMLMDNEQRQILIDTKVAHLYALLAEASPRSVNGYPTFLTMYTLDVEEAKYLLGKGHTILKAMKEAANAPFPAEGV